jgi:3-isopropylmalate dehydratase small subunit
MQRGDLTAFAEAVYLSWKQHPRQFPHELVEASEALVKREAFMVRSSRSPAPPA